MMKTFYKIFFFIGFYIVFIVFVYNYIWLNHETYTKDNRFKIYTGDIIEISCRNGKPGRVYLNFLLSSGSELEFKYKKFISCKDYYDDAFHEYKNKIFYGSFIGNELIELKINDKDLVVASEVIIQRQSDAIFISILVFLLSSILLLANIIGKRLKVQKKKLKVPE